LPRKLDLVVVLDLDARFRQVGFRFLAGDQPHHEKGLPTTPTRTAANPTMR
jgi:hypothetical protein